MKKAVLLTMVCIVSAVAGASMAEAVQPMVAAGGNHTVGLKSSGTVLGVGDYYYGQLAVEGWTDIVQVAASNNHTVGLKSDGTVVAVGDNRYGQCNVNQNWAWNLLADIDFDHDSDIDRDDINRISSFRGQDAEVCPECDLDEDGMITGLDARKAVLQCTRPGCATE